MSGTSMFNPNEKVEPINVAEEVSRSFLDYSMSVIISRALPDARDGLKPSQRRILRSESKRKSRAHQCSRGSVAILSRLLDVGHHFSRVAGCTRRTQAIAAENSQIGIQTKK